jgi:hypothetical protein
MLYGQKYVHTVRNVIGMEENISGHTKYSPVHRNKFVLIKHHQQGLPLRSMYRQSSEKCLAVSLPVAARQSERATPAITPGFSSEALK